MRLGLDAHATENRVYLLLGCQHKQYIQKKKQPTVWVPMQAVQTGNKVAWASRFKTGNKGEEEFKL